jgi:SPP1 gp7 family putative phage head morphogenesis protein
MCEVCNEIQVNVGTQLKRYDPTRTTMLRNAFVKDSNRRFDKLAVAVHKAIVDKNVFGTIQVNQLPEDNEYAQGSDASKIERFLSWLNKQLDEIVLASVIGFSLGKMRSGHWSDKFVYEAYKRGISRGRSEVRMLNSSIPTISNLDWELLDAAHKNTIDLLLNQIYNDYLAISDNLRNQISRVLTDSFLNGDTPVLIADKLVAVINGSGMGTLGISNTLGQFIPAKRRAEILLRTEVTRAHHLANINEYEKWQIPEVSVTAEFTSMRDGKVCSICTMLDGQIFTLEEIKTVIPVHAQCRCFAKPIVRNIKANLV